MRNRSIALLLISTLVLGSCKNTGEQAPSIQFTDEANIHTSDSAEPTLTMNIDTYDPDADFVCSLFLGDSFITEKYMLYHDYQGSLHFFNAADGSERVYCFSPGCEHERPKSDTSGQIIDPGCVSYNISGAPVMIRGDRLYFYNNMGIYRSDLQGENRRLVGTVPPQFMFGEIFFSKDAFFSAYSTQYDAIEVPIENGESTWVVGEAKETFSAGLVRMDLADGKCTEVFTSENYTSRIFKYDIRGDHLYFAYAHNDLPYMGPDGELTGTVPEEYAELSAEQYQEEQQRHLLVDIYDYEISTGKLNIILKDEQYVSVQFCNGFFALSATGGGVRLFKYDGEALREIKAPLVSAGVRTDDHLLVYNSDTTNEYLLIDENTGDVLKRTVVPREKIMPMIMIGDSCYGFVDLGAPWGISYCHIPTKDFWEGDTTNCVPFHAP